MNDSQVRTMIEDLASTLSASNHEWDEWQVEFIEDMAAKLVDNPIDVFWMSDKQRDQLRNLWEWL